MPKSRRYRNRSRGGGLLSRFFGSKTPDNTGQSTPSTGPSTEATPTGPSPAATLTGQSTEPTPRSFFSFGTPTGEESSLNSTTSIADSTQAAGQTLTSKLDETKNKISDLFKNTVEKVNEMIDSINLNYEKPPPQNQSVSGGMPGFANEYGLVQGGRLSSRKSRRRRRR